MLFPPDVNECTGSSHDCDENAECVDSEGSYNCVCKDGYVGDGSDCRAKGKHLRSI